MTLGGSGRCDADRLVAGEVAVERRRQRQREGPRPSALSVSIAGSGDIWYRGAAPPRTSIVGSGKVRPI